MFAKINFISYFIMSFVSVHFYVKSVSPAQLERVLGESAYAHCGKLRVWAIVFMTIAFINFITCRFLPVTRCLPVVFAWPRWVSWFAAALLAVPSLTLVAIGWRDAGSEAAVPDNKNPMYGGIYRYIRHPQAYEALLWPAAALALHSPFLLAISLPWLLLELIMVMAEEFDLALRFGESYLSYREKTGPFFPKIRH